MLEQTMFTMPKLGGREHFAMLVSEFGGRDLVAQKFRLAKELVDGYTSGAVEVPLVAQLAVYWQGSRGFNHAFRESHWTHTYNSWLKNEARDRVDLLEAFIAGCGLTAPPGALTTHRQMLAAGPRPVTGYGALPHGEISSRDVPGSPFQVPAIAPGSV